MGDRDSSNQISLSKLLCGDDFNPHHEIDTILKHLSKSIKNVLVELSGLPSLEEEKMTLYGPYLGRSLLDLSVTALVARLDPFRILVMKGKQAQPQYELDRPHRSALRWVDDVVAAAPKDIWEEKALNNPTRALLGVYQRKLVLMKSAERILDEGNESKAGEWYSKLAQKDAEGLVESIRIQINSLFSALSKGIHHELLIPIETVLDRDTVFSLVNDVLYVVSTLGLLVSFVPHAYQKCSEVECFGYYKTVIELEVV